MPHTTSAKKRLRQNEKLRLHNRAVKRALKKQMKALLEVIKSGPADKMQAEYNATAKKLDKAAAKRVIHPNLAARKKSQLAHAINAKAATAKPAAT
ncbi:MAG TPA: 30S ribosomal protein S20 [Gemmataceae bacterium]|nr:30S ribosomal protein S20 [Gemmataceae bacterium]